ncbi:MAG TPA: hypothetical protein VKJ01_15025, partial [Candidatus Solibacter sp.]|nr:hypothetical protein [Candidatus Solibacter sp.]
MAMLEPGVSALACVKYDVAALEMEKRTLPGFRLRQQPARRAGVGRFGSGRIAGRAEPHIFAHPPLGGGTTPLRPRAVGGSG